MYEANYKKWKRGEILMHGVVWKEYRIIHDWIRMKLGKANQCSSTECTKESNKYEWALKKDCSYAKDTNNFIQLCRKCHHRYDDKKIPTELLRIRSKTILQYSMMGRLIKQWDSAIEASRKIGINHSSICLMARGAEKRNHVGGYVWKYKN